MPLCTMTVIYKAVAWFEVPFVDLLACSAMGVDLGLSILQLSFAGIALANHRLAAARVKPSPHCGRQCAAGEFASSFLHHVPTMFFI